MMDQKEKIALVTGASSGIGEALSRELVSRGWRVIGVARSSDKLNQIKNDLKESFIPMICDLSNSENIIEISNQLVEMNLYPTLFFLNAGITGDQMIEKPNHLDMPLHQKFLNISYFGVLGWISYWHEICSKRGGAKFVVTSSLNAVLALPFRTAYCASKAAIAKAFECLAMTYVDTKVQFSIVYPGPVKTMGIRGSYPFTMEKEKLATMMVDFALSKKTRLYPSFFYHYIAVPFLRTLPDHITSKIFKMMHTK